MKKVKSSRWVLLLLAGTLAVATSCDPKNKPEDSKEVAEENNEAKFEDTKIEDDTEFAVTAADASQLEIQLGQLALTNSTTPEVKKLAQQMIDDHTKASEELKAVAGTKNISLPVALSDKCQKKYDDLSEKKGLDFDDAYSDLMVKEHKDVVDAFKKESEKGNDADLRAWATEKLPTLEHHLEMAKATEKVVDDKK